MLRCIPTLPPYDAQRFLRNEDFRVPGTLTRLEERGMFL